MENKSKKTENSIIRSKIMKSVKQKNTGPEMIVRKILSGLGYRYRLYRKDLPGTPDIVFVNRKKAIFINGCFWHRHNCPKASIPKTNKKYWENKFKDNVIRDQDNYLKLKELGWRVFVVWQCELHDLNKISRKLVRFIEGKKEKSHL
jgi:DNA mismatch endonuclease, patch repair protein